MMRQRSGLIVQIGSVTAMLASPFAGELPSLLLLLLLPAPPLASPPGLPQVLAP